MRTIGEDIKRIRQLSRHKDLNSFAGAAGLSKEGLRKIENGERIPGRDTLRQLLLVCPIRDAERDRLMKARDLAQANRDGLTLPRYATPERIRRIADSTQRVVLGFLDEFDLDFSPEDKRDLHGRIINVLNKETRD